MSVRTALGISAAGALLPASALAAAMNRPFQVGGGEGGGGAVGGVTGWLLGAQSQLTHEMSGYLRALPHDASALWSLVLIGFLYGVFHAAGPGHGKAVIASYVTASDRALRRGTVLALLAALLQAVSAIALVGIAAALFAATAATMNRVADALATASYAGIVVIGAWLTARKGYALARLVRLSLERRATTSAGVLFAGAPWQAAPAGLRSAPLRAFGAEGPAPAADCGHEHMPDPRRLEDGFSWRGAAAAVVFAGARPCSGALLILVYALAQHLFWAGVAATFAMSLGTAATTGALAALSVFAKSAAIRAAGRESLRVAIIARGFEFAAALLVLLFGVALLFAARLAA